MRKSLTPLRSLIEGIIVHTAIEATIVSFLTKAIDNVLLGVIVGIVAVEIGHVIYQEVKHQVFECSEKANGFLDARNRASSNSRIDS